MANEGTTVVLGIPIPSTNPVFLAIIGVHVLFGLSAVIAGGVAMLSTKGRGRHSNFGTIYFRCLFGVFVTMSALSFMRWADNYHLFILGMLSFASALFGRFAVQWRLHQWPRLHLTSLIVARSESYNFAVSQTPLDLATLHVIRGAEIVARQYEMVARLRARGWDTSMAEETLSVFLASQRIFEEHRR